MKIILAILLSSLSFVLFAQQPVFKISAQKQIVSVHLNEDNSNKKITIDTKGRIANVQRFSIRSIYPELDKNQVRTFQFVGDNGDSKITITDDKETGVFNIGIKELVDKLRSGSYRLYTLAIPRDTAAAAAAQPKRILVATLELI